MLPSSHSRLIGLDLLRVFAVLLVMGRHYPFPSEAPAAWQSFAKVIATGGWVGVDLFFVLSGFLVSGLLFREHATSGSVSAGRFLIRRAFKIYPAFWVMIGGVVLFRMLNGTKLVPAQIFSELLFVQNYFTALCGHTWSLAVEEHFYLFLSCLIVWLVRRQPSRPFDAIPIMFVCVAVSCLVFRAWQRTVFVPFDAMKHSFPSHLRIDSLMFGVLLSYWWHLKADAVDFARLRRWSGLLLFASLLGFIPAFLFPLEQSWWIPVAGVVLFYIASGGLILGALGIEWRKENKFLRSLAWMGGHSYSVYLWHSFVFFGLFKTITHFAGRSPHWLVALAYFLLASWGIGILMARLVEVPVLKFRDKFFPSLSTKNKQPKVSVGDVAPAYVT